MDADMPTVCVRGMHDRFPKSEGMKWRIDPRDSPGARPILATTRVRAQEAARRSGGTARVRCSPCHRRVRGFELVRCWRMDTWLRRIST